MSWNLSPFIETTSFVSNEMSTIPDGTTAMAVIDDASWNEYQGEQKIRLKWLITGGEHDGRTVVQNLKAKDSKEAVLAKAMEMIAFLNNRTNRKMPNSRYPSDEELASSLIGVKAAIKISIWENTNGTGNYVAALGDQLASFESTPGPKPAQSASASTSASYDDEIGF